MAVQLPPKSGYEKWQDGIDSAAGDTKWDAHDCEIQMTVSEYNRHLSGTDGYIPLDWRLVKAMLWVETGAERSEWNIRPMQIGNDNDPGLAAFLSTNEGGDLILPPKWTGSLTVSSARSNPSHNIRAGVGYLLMKMANYEYRSVPAADAEVRELTVKPGDSLDRIARTHGSTVDMLRSLNPAARVLQPGQKLKYRKASNQKVITGWRRITTASIAQRYNGGGDFLYAKKLDYALSLIVKGKVALCAQ